MSALALYRNLRKAASQIADYNFRSYALRRSRLGFEQHRSDSPAQAEQALAWGTEQLGLVRRHAIMSQLYP
ncbi:unnamed protein product, partial [Chrysoparadoxa australica]